MPDAFRQEVSDKNCRIASRDAEADVRSMLSSKHSSLTAIGGVVVAVVIEGTVTEVVEVEL